jgi:hypothetical protein
MLSEGEHRKGKRPENERVRSQVFDRAGGRENERAKG